MNDAAMQKVEAESTPKLAAFGDEIVQNEQLFARIKAVYDARETSNLTPEQQRLTWVVYNSFVPAGARRWTRPKKARLGQINQALASLYTKLQPERAGRRGGLRTLELAEGDLAGLPDRRRPAAAGGRRGSAACKGKWADHRTPARPMEPFLTYSDRRDLREKGWRPVGVSRGDNNDAQDNKAVITEILKLRAERAQLLGFPTHAHWISSTTRWPRRPDAAMDLMMQVWQPAVRPRPRGSRRHAERWPTPKRASVKIEPWDYRYYAEKVRKASYDLDQNEVKPYLQLEKLREAMHWAAGQLYGFTFTQITDVPVCHPDVRVWEVTTRAASALRPPVVLRPLRPRRQAVGRLDERVPHPGEVQGRDHRRSSRNNSQLREGQARRAGADLVGRRRDHVPRVRPRPARPELRRDLSVALAGTNVARDFVEFPSQLNEHWLLTRPVLEQFAVHYKTGKPIPAELVGQDREGQDLQPGLLDASSTWPRPSTT